MTPLYEEVARSVAALDQVWSTLLSRLAEVEAERRAAAELLESLGGHEPEFERLRDELESVAAVVRGDPRRWPGTAAPTPRGSTPSAPVSPACAARWPRRSGCATGSPTGSAGSPPSWSCCARRRPGARAPGRGARQDRLPGAARPARHGGEPRRPAQRGRRAGRGGWHDLAERVGGLERAAAAALERAREAARVVGGLLDRREELRGPAGGLPGEGRAARPRRGRRTRPDLRAGRASCCGPRRAICGARPWRCRDTSGPSCRGRRERNDEPVHGAGLRRNRRRRLLRRMRRGSLARNPGARRPGAVRWVRAAGLRRDDLGRLLRRLRQPAGERRAGRAGRARRPSGPTRAGRRLRRDDHGRLLRRLRFAARAHGRVATTGSTPPAAPGRAAPAPAAPVRGRRARPAAAACWAPGWSRCRASRTGTRQAR